WFEFVGSAKIDDTARFGCTAVSIRVNATPAWAAALMFFAISTRPPPVPAHIVPSSAPRESDEMVLPPFVVPYGDVAPALVNVDVPSFSQSAAVPHAPV